MVEKKKQKKNNGPNHHYHASWLEWNLAQRWRERDDEEAPKKITNFQSPEDAGELWPVHQRTSTGHCVTRFHDNGSR